MGIFVDSGPLEHSGPVNRYPLTRIVAGPSGGRRYQEMNADGGIVARIFFSMNPDDFSNQILVAVTTILTVIAFAFSIESNLPKVPYIAYIDAFFLCCYFFVFVTVLELMAVHMTLRSRGGLPPNFQPFISRVRRLFRPSWGVSFCGFGFVVIAVFRAAPHSLRAVEKLSGFGSETGAPCRAPASSWFAGQAVRAMAEFP